MDQHEKIVQLTRELKECQSALAQSSASLAAMFGIAEALNKANTAQDVCEGALQRALALPGVRAGWITVVDEAGNFALLASRNLPPALEQPGAMDGLCLCRRKLLAGELDSVTDVLECERLQKARSDAQSFRFHTSVPIWIGGRTLGIMNLVGSEGGLFSDEDRKNLYAVGNQLGVALERARLHEGLERLVEERTAKLAAEVEERKRAEREVRALGADLERRVRERTGELEAANEELESFSYSVSHDLRAPLRHIDGYLQMLAEDTAGTLSSEAQRCLKVVADAARKMGKLIDDLLAFSRMARSEMSEIPIDLNALVQEVIRELEMTTRERNIAWTIQALPAVKGDPSMVKQVFANVLGNAAKYTGPRDAAKVEVGCNNGEEDGRRVFFVRDNGVGFDMRYQDKLFGVFQRLHGASEFDGTGIGLANVRRIIERHGGRIWAEAAIGQGATFYFTLQPS